MSQNLIENEIKCKIHGESAVLYNQDECESFQSRFYCLSCLDTITLTPNSQNHKNIKVNRINGLTQSRLSKRCYSLKQQIFQSKNDSINQDRFNQIQLQYIDWVDKIQNLQFSFSDNVSLLEQLESLSKEQHQNIGFKKEIWEINLNQYQQMYKLLDDLIFKIIQTNLKECFRMYLMFLKMSQQKENQRQNQSNILLKANPLINVVCQEHNNRFNIQALNRTQKMLGRDQNVLNVKQVRLFLLINFSISFQNQRKNKIRYIFIKQMNKVQEQFKQFRRQYLQQIKQIIQEPNLLIINEINQDTLFAQNQFVCGKEKDLIQMVGQIINFEDQKTFQEEQDLQKHQSAINSMIIKNSTQTKEIIMNQQSCLIELINQTSDELDQQTYTYQDKQKQITDYLVKDRMWKKNCKRKIKSNNQYQTLNKKILS